jgi:hypothetical protein
MTSTLAFSVNKQKDISVAGRRSPSEAAVFAEVTEVLKKHGLEKKYGISLLHKHFDLEADEMLVEYTDIENRTLISKPTKINSIPTENLIETVWCLDEDTAALACVVFCYGNPTTGQHVPQHTAQ